MQQFLTGENVIAAVAVISVVVNGFLYFQRPQIKSEQKESILSLQIKTLQEEIINLKDNHIHSLELAIGDTNKNLNVLTVQVAKLATVIEERVPHK